MKKVNLQGKHFLTYCLFYLLTGTAVAQVKIGNNPNTINANSLLELESTNKGFLPPRVALTDFNSVAPLTGTLPAGMLVFSTGGVLADGYYYWNGVQWIAFISVGEASITTKTTSVTLTKAETFVVASNDITLNLPAITAADDGLTITIKNIGAHTDQVNVVPSGSSTIDGIDLSKHFRWIGKTYVASAGHWIIRGNVVQDDHIFEVSSTGSWTTIKEASEFLNLHMIGPSIIKLLGGDYPVLATQVINLPYPVTIQGSSYGTSYILADAGLSGAMFSCETETYFKMLAFEGSGSGVDAIHMVTGGEYFEIKDCTFDNFNNAIVAKSNVEMWVFEVDILNAVTAGIALEAGATSGVSMKISETDFIGCAIGINFLSGSNPIVSVLNCGFYNKNVAHRGINYVPATFTSIFNMFITNNTWNNVGTFMSGFDFSRADGRDANTFISNNSGGQDRNPNCRINVNSNGTATSITTAGTWYKAVWSTQTSTTTKWTVTNNRIAYQPVNRSDGWAIITGNIRAPSNNRTISIAIVKNGNTAMRFGETDLRLSVQNQPYQFATTIYLTDIGPTDYFEIYCTSANSGETTTFQDVQWFTETK